MKISVSLKLESLLRGMRLTGHALAEGAEQKVLRAVRQDARRPQGAAADEAGRKGREA